MTRLDGDGTRGEVAELPAQAFAGAGVTHEMVFLPGKDHGFDADRGGFGARIARARVRAFLEWHSAGDIGP